MQLPKPTEDHLRLHRLAGTWRGTETMLPSQWDPKGSVAQGESDTRVDLGGFAVIVDYRQLRGGEVTFSGHGVYSLDADAGEVVLHWWDCTGAPAEVFRGTWDGDVLRLQARNHMGFMRSTYDVSTPGRLGSSMEMSPDGETWNRLFEGEYEDAAG